MTLTLSNVARTRSSSWSRRAQVHCMNEPLSGLKHERWRKQSKLKVAIRSPVGIMIECSIHDSIFNYDEFIYIYFLK